jgi:hypothetical protein
VLPEPFETMNLGHSLGFNTPYVLCQQQAGRFVFTDANEWHAFVDRTMPKTGIGDGPQAYAHLTTDEVQLVCELLEPVRVRGVREPQAGHDSAGRIPGRAVKRIRCTSRSGPDNMNDWT